jgi:uncharacterized protein
MISIHQTSTGVSFVVKVQPCAKKNAIMGELDDALRLWLTAPALAGKANQACIEFLATVLKVPRSSITIASGRSSRRKVIGIEGFRRNELEERLSNI